MQFRRKRDLLRFTKHSLQVIFDEYFWDLFLLDRCCFYPHKKSVIIENGIRSGTFLKGKDLLYQQDSVYLSGLILL